MFFYKYLIPCVSFLITVSVVFSLSIQSSGQSLHLKLADSFYQQGSQKYEQQEFSEAIASWQRALDLYRDLSAIKRQGKTLSKLGDAYLALSQYDQAINYYEKSIAIAQQFSKLSLVKSDALIHLGYIYLLLGNYQTSIQHSEQGLETARNIKNNFLGESVALNNLGSAYKSICQYDRAQNYHGKSLELATTIDYRKGKADALGNLGNLYQVLNQPLAALDAHETNLTLAKQLNDRRGEANALGNIGLAYHALADYPEAETYHQQRLELAQQIGDRQGVAKAIGDLGSVYYRYGQYTKAIKHHQQHLDIATEMNDRQGQVSALSNLGNNYNALGQSIEAMQYLQQAWEIAKQIGDCRSEVGALNGIGLSLQDLGSYQEAIQYFERSLELAQKHQNERGKGHVVGNLGSAYLEWGIRDDKQEHYQKAVQFYQQKVEIVRKNKDLRSEGAVLTNMGIAYTQLNQFVAATDSFDQAKQILQEIGDRDAYGQALAGTAFLQEQQGDTDRAIKLYKEAIEIKENIRSQLMVGAFKSSFEERQVDIYEEIIKLLWQQGEKEQAFDYVERARAKTFLDRLADGQINFRTQADPALLAQEQQLQLQRITKRNELIALKNRPDSEQNESKIAETDQKLGAIESQYTNLLTQIELQHPELANLVSHQPRKLLSLAQIQEKLDPDTTLLEYFVTENQTFAFIITPNSFNAIALPITQKELRESLRLFRQFANISRPHPNLLQQLHQWLIAPLQSHLNPSRSNLIIIPHGILHYLPFAALTDGENYLIDTYNFSTLPSANVLNFLANEKSEETGGSLINVLLSKLNQIFAFFRRDHALVLGNPDIEAPLPPLLHAQAEAKTIASLYQTEPLIGDEATETMVRSQGKNHQIVHLAAHGKYNNRNPLFSTLYLAKDEQNQHDGRLEVHEIYELNFEKADLVVLSACETNIGDLSKGDEVVGLNRALIYAETPTVIASLWSVDDEPTKLLMAEFYKHLRSGKAKAKALRQAQQAVQQDYPHPYFWAAFSLTGNGRN